jgi:hypothetical protein
MGEVMTESSARQSQTPASWNSHPRPNHRQGGSPPALWLMHAVRRANRLGVVERHVDGLHAVVRRVAGDEGDETAGRAIGHRTVHCELLDLVGTGVRQLVRGNGARARLDLDGNVPQEVDTAHDAVAPDSDLECPFGRERDAEASVEGTPDVDPLLSDEVHLHRHYRAPEGSARTDQIGHAHRSEGGFRGDAVPQELGEWDVLSHGHRRAPIDPGRGGWAVGHGVREPMAYTSARARRGALLAPVPIPRP